MAYTSGPVAWRAEVEGPSERIVDLAPERCERAEVVLSFVQGIIYAECVRGLSA